MYLVVHHEILDHEKFSDAVKECLDCIPEGIKIHKVLQNSDKTKACCLWESDKLSSLKIFLEGHTGDFSNNNYMIVDEENSIGI